MLEIELYGVTFIENDFPSIGETTIDLELYGLQELEGITPSFGEVRESQSHIKIAKDSGIDLPPSPSGSVPLERQWSQSMLFVHNSTRGYLVEEILSGPRGYVSGRGSPL